MKAKTRQKKPEKRAKRPQILTLTRALFENARQTTTVVATFYRHK
jgi:hypothetical protein|tara:strand:- start:413 stop:547 length:135 start_codon:yes stop_codon:yes gene_type:complete